MGTRRRAAIGCPLGPEVTPQFRPPPGRSVNAFKPESIEQSQFGRRLKTAAPQYTTSGIIAVSAFWSVIASVRQHE
ncbi:hypothetical protein LX36DRAFT_60791 [Colletotrichum falcatum]|nr:hypothetical protein LX36DRAFT_60791 [Colletotrichum falcatum]